MEYIDTELGEDVNGVTVHEKLDEIMDTCSNGGSIEDREALAIAITDKGVKTNVYDSLSLMAENVSNIITGYVFGTPSDVYNRTYNDQDIGYTYTNATGERGIYLALAGGRNVSTSSTGTVIFSITISRASATLAVLENGDSISTNAAWDNGQIYIAKVG